MAAARDLRFPDLVWSHFSRPRFGGFDERVRAAAAAGFDGIGLYVHEYARLRDEEGRSAADIRALLDDHGVVLADAEVAHGWWATEGAEYETAQRIESLAFEMADEFGVRYLQAIGPYDCRFEQAVQGFARLCDRAAEHGLLVGIEGLPYTNIANAADAQRVIRAADRPNGGYCADIWHHTRGANDLSLIQALEPERVFAIQMNDGTLLPRLDDYKPDCLTNRVPPGEGEFDCVGFLRTLRAMGVDAPISVEVCSAELWEAPIDVAARRSADGMRAVLAGLDAHVDVDGCLNFRDAGRLPTNDGGRMRRHALYRSDDPVRLTPQGRETVAALGLAHVVDLRQESQYRRGPGFLPPEHTDHVPLMDRVIDPENPPSLQNATDITNLYVSMLDRSRAQIARALDSIAEHVDEGPVLVHCVFGKDRAGLLLALVQAAIGVPADSIVVDYARSHHPGRRRRAWMLAEPWPDDPDTSHVPEFLFSAPAETMRMLLDRMVAEHGSLDDWIASFPTRPDTIGRLRNGLVER